MTLLCCTNNATFGYNNYQDDSPCRALAGESGLAKKGV